MGLRLGAHNALIALTADVVQELVNLNLPHNNDSDLHVKLTFRPRQINVERYNFNSYAAFKR